ncbi:uroporphyrinogen-III C-methyltransferase, partial [Corynebacterium heidelbergense]
MTLHLTRSAVLIAEGPGAELAAQRVAEQGASPTIVSPARLGGGDRQGLADPAAFGPRPVQLCLIPGRTPNEDAELVLDWAAHYGLPVEDHRGRDLFPRSGSAEKPSPGRVTLVGGGPGSADLITVAGKRAVAEADVVLADHLGPFHLAEEAAREGAELIDVSKLPYGKQVSQDKINELIVSHASQGKHVVRLKGGDPFIFGRGFEEAEACAQAGIPYTVIPGVTSATSAPALAGLSLTHRGLVHEVTIISGHLPPGHPKSLVRWDAVAQMRGSLVLIMAVKNAPAIAAELIRCGRSPQVAVAAIESASTPQQRVSHTTLSTLATDGVGEVGAPAIFVV